MVPSASGRRRMQANMRSPQAGSAAMLPGRSCRSARNVLLWMLTGLGITAYLTACGRNRGATQNGYWQRPWQFLAVRSLRHSTLQ